MTSESAADRPRATEAPRRPPTVVKKYANRRLYNTSTSSYVTLEALAQMVREDEEFIVYDAKTGDDITRQVLTQIIVEQEAKGQNLLPIDFLRQLISFYGSQNPWALPNYLNFAMKAFATNQDRMRDFFQPPGQTASAALNPFAALGEMSKQNLAMFDQMWRIVGEPGGAAPAAASPARPAAASPAEARLDQMTQQIQALQAQLETLRRARGEQ